MLTAGKDLSGRGSSQRLTDSSAPLSTSGSARVVLQQQRKVSAMPLPGDLSGRSTHFCIISTT